MIYIFEGGSVVYDGSTISEEEKAKAIVVAERPEEDFIEGKIAVLKWNVETQTAWYEYEDIPKSEEDIKIEELEQKINLQQILMDDLLLNVIPMLMGGEI